LTVSTDRNAAAFSSSCDRKNRESKIRVKVVDFEINNMKNILKLIYEVLYALVSIPVVIWQTEKCKRKPECRARLYPKD
jgi:hypothetical protein